MNETEPPRRTPEGPARGLPGPDATQVSCEPGGFAPDGRGVNVFTLANAGGLEVRFTDYGGIVLSVRVADRNGAFDDVTLGFDELDAYFGPHPYFGALIGRYANRIANGRFALDGQRHVLTINDPPNHLHGGSRGFDRAVWQAETFRRDTRAGAVLTYVSPDGDQGYPGRLEARVTYALTKNHELIFNYQASSDRATPVNFSQHTYFNLAGTQARDILGHELMLNARRFTPVDSTMIPTGELRSVAGTPFDFTEPLPIGGRIEDDDEQLRFGGGYDHNWVLERAPGEALTLAARLYEPLSGRALEVFTTEPGIQFYSGNRLDGRLTGKQGRIYGPRAGLALETQHFPDSPNQPTFPSTILRPGQTYESRTVYRFSVRQR
jgi:aldose 1-epimerase